MAVDRSSAVRLVRFLVGLFFRRIEVSGEEHVPTTGGGILIAWHPNGLLDPALIIRCFPRRVVFGARHGLFRWPLLGRLMRALGTVPIFRASDLEDADDETRRTANRKSLDAPDMAERALGMSRVWKAYYARLRTDPDGVQTLLDRVAYYDRALLEVELEDDDLDKPPQIESRWLPLILGAQAAVVFLVFPPVLALGSLINAGPYFVVNLISRLGSKQYKDTATIKLLAGVISFPVTWLAAALLVGFGQIQLHDTFAGIPRAPWAAGSTTFLIGAFGGALALVYLELVRRTWTSIKIRAKRQWGSTIIEQLSAERSTLFDAIEEMREGLELPGDVLADGRIGVRELTLDPEDLP